MKFEHHLLEGTHYEIGKKQAEIMKNKANIPMVYLSGKFNKTKSNFDSFDEAFDFYNSYCPGLQDEAEGYADVFDAKVNQLMLYDFPASSQNCSQFAILPQITKNDEILVGRSYEWKHDDESLELRTTHVKGKYRHLAFSCIPYGRYEGINNQGLCVTSTAGGAWRGNFKKKSISWDLVLRVIIENCKDTSEALRILEEIPIYGTSNFLVVDKSGKAILLESFDTEIDVREYDAHSEEQYIISTNHYTSSKIEKYNEYNIPWLISNSKKRREIIEGSIKSNEGTITPEDIREILSREFPEGICCHWFTDYFGTLWSVYFNVRTCSAEVCFGPPTHNKWFSFNLNEPIVRNDYEVTFPDKRIEM